MNEILKIALVPVATFLTGLLSREISVWVKKLIVKLKSNPKTAPLADIVQVGEDVLDSGLSAAAQNANKTPAEIAKAAEDAAKATAEANKDKLGTAAAAEGAVLAPGQK